MQIKKFSELTVESLEAISYYIKEFDDSFSMNFHSHEYIEFMYCETGQFRFELLDQTSSLSPRKNHSIIVTSGDLVFVDILTPHRISIDPDRKAVIYNVELKAKSYYTSNNFNADNVLKLDLEKFIRYSPLQTLAKNQNGYLILRDTSDIGHSFRRYISELNKGTTDLCDSLVVQSRLVLLLAEIARSVPLQSTSIGTQYIRKASQFIKTNYMLNISVNDIADHVGINKAYLQRLFKQYTGTTILACINNYRIEKCKLLLSTTNFSIVEIAGKTGFQNRQHLIYVFRQYCGCSPSEYRKDCLKQHIDHRPDNYASNIYES